MSRIAAVAAAAFFASATPAVADDYASVARNIIPSGQYGSAPPPVGADEQALHVRRAHAALRPGHQRRPDDEVQVGGVRGGAGRSGPPGDGAAGGRDDRARPLQRPAHHGPLARRRDVGDGLGAPAGPRAPARPGARRGQARGDRRAQRLRLRPGDQPAPVQADPGRGPDDRARRPAGAARRGRARQGRAARRRRLPAGRQRAAEGGGLRRQAVARADIFAANAIIGEIFGEGGGDEARRSEFLSSLRKRVRHRTREPDVRRLQRVRRPRRAVDDDTHLPVRDDEPRTGSGNAVLDAGSFKPTGPQRSRPRGEGPALGEQLPARERQALVDRAPAVRRRPADRLHVPRAHARGRHQLAGRAGARRDRAGLRRATS